MGSVCKTSFHRNNSVLSSDSHNDVDLDSVYDVNNTTPDITIPRNSNFNKQSSTVDLKVNPNVEETPIKKALPLKRKSLMRDMNCEEMNTKHPMAMRSRKRLKLSPYYDYQEYVDFAEDLSFLFDEELPDFEPRPRRTKTRKKKSACTKLDTTPKFCEQKGMMNRPSTSQSKLSDANDTTSIPNGFSTDRPTRNISPVLNSDLTNCNTLPTSFNESSCSKFSGKKLDLSSKNNCENQSQYSDSGIKNRKGAKRRRMIDDDHEKSESVLKKTRNSRKSDSNDRGVDDKTKRNQSVRKGVDLNLEKPKFCHENFSRNSLLEVSCVLQKLDSNRNKYVSAYNSQETHCDVNNGTVTRMNLRRRHSSPQIFTEKHSETSGGRKMIQRTVSSPAGSLGGEDFACQKERAPKTRDLNEPYSSSSSPSSDDIYSGDDVSYAEQFVDSPDSGFISESSCSVASPSGDPTGSFFYSPSKTSKSDIDCDVIKDSILRTTSTDSGIQVIEEGALSTDNEPLMTNQLQECESEMRLILCQESVKEKQRLELEAKKKAEEQALIEKYRCRWKDCPSPMQNKCVADLHDHLQEFHVEKKKLDKYCCNWVGCKMFEKYCRKLAWIQRHVGEHSGQKPYKCILDGCGASFSSISSRKRHVEAHYSEVSLPKARVGGDHGPLSRLLLNTRRVQNKKKTLANRIDCMDKRTLGFITGAIVQNEISTAAESVGNASEIVFRSEVLGRKTTLDGSKSVLVRWHPANMIPDEWIPEGDLEEEKTIKRGLLPWSAKSCLRKLFFFGRKPIGRKPGKI